MERIEHLAHWNILIVDDNADDRADIRQMLIKGSRRTCHITEAELGSTGLQMVLDNQSQSLSGTAAPFDCVLIDFNLPDINATQWLTSLCNAPGVTPCPVVVTTGWDGVDVSEGPNLLQAGAQDYIGKSWTTAPSLCRAIENSIERFKLRQTRDLTRQALVQSEERYRTLFNSIDEGYCIIEMIFDAQDQPVDYRFLEVSRSFERQTGLTDAVGKRILQLIPSLEIKWLQVYGKVALTGEPIRVEDYVEQMNRWFDLYAFQFGDPAKRQVGILFNNTTERKKAERARTLLEAQLRESQKMEALGTLAGGIAHDFNNILGIILTNAELARQDARANWQALVSLEEIKKAGHRARDLVQQILSFSRRQRTSRRVMSLASIVEESVRLLRAGQNGMRIECHCAADTPSVLADPTQVQQVLLNLGTNAAHAIKDRPGSIDIRMEGITFDETSAPFDISQGPGRYLRIVVSDTGHGMDAATQKRIFEPFFTTKPPGMGTGLGLSVVHGIMQDHQGEIVVHSEPGKGSTIELYFPSSDEAAAALDTTEVARPANEGRGRRILYIEDDEAQLFVSKRMLERWGYSVSAYIEQREALDAVLSGKIHFDLVVTDCNMPGTSGLEIATAIHHVRPELPVIMVSGYITDELRWQAVAAGVCELISKPQNLEELRDAVQRFIAPTPDESALTWRITKSGGAGARFWPRVPLATDRSGLE